MTNNYLPQFEEVEKELLKKMELIRSKMGSMNEKQLSIALAELIEMKNTLNIYKEAWKNENNTLQ